MLITSKHVRAAGLCGRGAVNRMKAMGLSNAEIVDALTNGIPEERLRQCKDTGLTDRIIAAAYKMEREG